MDSRSLTRRQVQHLAAVNDRHLVWLNRLQQRLNLRGFPIDDELRRVVNKARDGTHHLRIVLHYLETGNRASPITTPPSPTAPMAASGRDIA